MTDGNGYFLTSPPRQVPVLVQGKVLFGGMFNQIGWFWLGFTLVFFWIFGLSADFTSILFAFGEVDTAQGVVTRVEQTSASENEEEIYAYHYSFRIERFEAEYEGVSYTTGQEFLTGTEVAVEFLSRDPEMSRIHGARGGTFSLWVVCLVAIFPAIGLILIAFGLRNGIKANRLLKHGTTGLGTLIAKEATNASVNDQTVYKLTFELFAENGGRYEVVTKTHRPQLLEDEAEERLLYDTRNPAYAVMFDNLPGQPKIDTAGKIHAGGFGGSIGVLILPALVLTIHGFVFLVLLLTIL